MKKLCLSILLCSTMLLSNDIDCKKALHLVDKALCKNTTLMKLNEDVEAMFKTLQTKLTDENKYILETTQKYFSRERNSCSNQDSSKGDFYTLIDSCIKNVLENRMKLLSNVNADDTKTRQLVKGNKFVDPEFFRKFSKDLIGEEIKIWGTLILFDENKPFSQRLSGGIFEDRKSDSKPIPVVFKSMTETEATFLTNKKPGGHHLGLVKEDGERIVFYLTSVLGKALP